MDFLIARERDDAGSAAVANRPTGAGRARRSRSQPVDVEDRRRRRHQTGCSSCRRRSRRADNSADDPHRRTGEPYRSDRVSGGKIDPHDESPVAAALREAKEEIGLEPTLIEPSAISISI